MSQSFADENASSAVSIHQRQKSLGNIKTVTSTASLVAPAKRTAFADVSNLRAPVDIGTKNPASLGGKATETGQGKAFLAPAQRSKALSSIVLPNLPRPTAVPSSELPSSIASRATVIQQIPSKTIKPRAPIGSENLDLQQLVSSVTFTTEANRKSPRRHKSQPHLAADRATLRRTQSRILEKVRDPEKVVQTELMLPFQAATHEGESKDSQQTPQLNEVITLLQQNASKVAAEAAEAADPILAVPSKPEPDVLEAARPLAPGPAPLPDFGEMDENWDDDEEFYDDQAYTTAHSYRSYGENTTGGATTFISLPKITAQIQRDLDDARQIVDSNLRPQDVEEEAWDPSMVAEYGDEIFEYMRDLEVGSLAFR
jgi:G2/mitotic-specific cyclin 3/4